MSDEPSRDRLYTQAAPVVRTMAWLLRHSNRQARLRGLSVRFNQAVLRGGAYCLGRRSGVDAVFLRHSAMTEDFVPWISDFDLDVIVADDQDTLATSRGVWRTFAVLKRCYPLFGELEVQTQRELALWQRRGGVEALETRHWAPLVGDVPRAAPARHGEQLARVHIAVEAFNLLFWQVYGVIFSPKFNGQVFCKVFAKLLRVLTYTPQNLDSDIQRSRRSVLARLSETDPLITALLDRIARRDHQHIDGDVAEALQFLFDRLLAQLPDPQPARTTPLEVTMAHERPTRNLVLELLAPALADFRRIPGITDTLLLSGRLGDSGALGNYNYKLYLCLRSSDVADWARRLAQVREVFDRHRQSWPFNYFGACSLPILVPAEALRFALRLWDPIEGVEHALHNQQSFDLGPFFEDRALAFFSNTNRHYRGFAFNRPFTDRVRHDFGAELTLVDYVFTLAQLRLALEHQQLGVTPRDVVDSYCAKLTGRHDLARELRSWHQRYGALRPSDMADVLDMRRLATEAHPLIERQKAALFDWVATRPAP